MLPVYVINLDRRPDRWAVMSEQLDRLGMEAERIPAVDARDLPATGRINRGSAANIQSHAAAMSRLLESDAPAALILEDDAELAAGTPALLRSVDWWPVGAMLIRLEAVARRLGLYGEEGRTPDGRALRRYAKWAGGSASYLVNRVAARIVLETLENPRLTIDRILFDLRYSAIARRLRPYQIVPPMARQRDDGPSDITPWHRRWRRDNSPRTLKQIVASLPYRLSIAMPRAAGRVRPVDCTFRE